MRLRPLLLILVLGMATIGGCGGEDATDAAGTPDLEVVDAVTPEPAAPDLAAVYLTIRNTGDGPDALTGGSTDIAAAVEVHETVIEDGVASMQPIPELVVPAGGEVVLERGGHHLMLLDPEPLAPGDTYPLTLSFAESGDVQVEVTVVERTGDMGHMAGGSDGPGEG